MARTRNSRLNKKVTRQQKRLQAAFFAREKGATLHEAAKIARMSTSGFWYKFLTRHNDTRYARTELTEEEEHQIVEVLSRHAANGRYLRMVDLMDVVEMMVKNFPKERQEKLRFINGRPGRKFCTAFQKRHSDKISFRKPSKQEAKRFLATSADVLTDHFAKVERLVTEHSIDPKRMINLDESGVSADRDNVKSTNGKVYCTRSSVPETLHAQFANVNRISLLACVHANGDVARPMFVLQGTRLRYRMCQNSSDPTRKYEETIADCLPRHALVATRPDVASVDKRNFLAWTTHLIDDLQDLTRNGRKVLLIYDGYRSHMSIEALEMFHKAGIIAYALPAHTSGTTQPLDRSMFAPWKSYYRQCVDTVLAGRKRNDRPLNEFDVCELMTRAYTHAFNPENVVAGFRVTGLCPLDPSKLIGRPRILSSENAETMVDVDTMMDMLEKKRRLRSRELLEEKVVLKNGFIDTTKGAVLTSERALELLRDELAVKVAKEQLRQERVEEKLLKEQDDYARKKGERLNSIVTAMRRRHKLYGDPLVLPRTLAERREWARKRVGRIKGFGETGLVTGTECMVEQTNVGNASVRSIPIEDSYDQWASDEGTAGSVRSEGDVDVMEMSMTYGML